MRKFALILFIVIIVAGWADGKDDYKSFHSLKYFFDTYDYRSNNPCTSDLMQRDWSKYRRCLLKTREFSYLKKQRNPEEKKIFNQKLPEPEVLRKLGETQLSVVVEKENLRISVAFLEGDSGKYFWHYSKLRMRVLVESVR